MQNVLDNNSKDQKNYFIIILFGFFVNILIICLLFAFYSLRDGKHSFVIAIFKFF